MNVFNKKLLRDIEEDVLVVSDKISNFDITIKLKDKLDSNHDIDISLMSILLKKMIEEIKLHDERYQEQLEAMAELQNNYWKSLEEASLVKQNLSEG